MKQLIACLFASAAVLSLSIPAQADEFKTKRCVNMGNALDAPSEGKWGHTIESRSFKVIADAGFDTVRIPVRWSAHTGGGPDYKIKERFFRRVTEVIDQALANNLQVILNIHHFEELNEDPEKYSAKFLALWSQIAPRYKDLPESVYFEVVNEPNGEFKGDVMRRIVTEAFKKIRETNPTRIIIMGGDEWSNIKTLPSIPSIQDPNQVYTFHYYDPYKFTHQKASWTDLKNSRSVSWGSGRDKSELRAAADYAARVQKETGVPIFIGEIGAFEKAPYEDIVEYTRETRKAFENKGLSWCVWNFAGTFPFYDTESRRWDLNKLDALGLSPNGVVSQASSESLPEAAPLKPTGSPYEGQSIDDAFNGIRRQIGQDGELLMAPFVDQINSYGPAKTKLVEDRGAPDGEALEVKLSRKGRNPWDSGLSGAVPGGVKKGDVIIMSYWAKAVSGEGVIANAGLQVNRAPYDALTLEPAQLTSQWKHFYITHKAEQDYGPSEAGYTIQVAGAKQTLRFGPVFIMNLGPNVDPSALP